MLRKIGRALRLLFILALLVLFVFGIEQILQGISGAPPADIPIDDTGLTVHFIDVGQGDAALLHCDGEYMLIDAGPQSAQGALTQYLTAQEIDRFSYVVATHPHEDHIGNLPVVLREYTVDTLIMPDATANTKIFESFLKEAYANVPDVQQAKAGRTYTLGGAKFTIVAPNSASYFEENDYSVGIHFIYGQTTFLFTGDAEESSEREMMTNGLALSADVFKAAHHGSKTSNTSAFLQAVSPDYVVISCGRDNSYGHPAESVVRRFAEVGATVYRTDMMGTVVFDSDGRSVEARDGISIKAFTNAFMDGGWLVSVQEKLRDIGRDLAGAGEWIAIEGKALWEKLVDLAGSWTADKAETAN